MENLAPLGAILTLAFLCESLTEYFFKDVLAAFGIDTNYLRYIAAVLGIGLCLAYGLDVFGEFLGLSPRFAYMGEVLTGLILGRGANYVHDFYKSYVRPKTE